MDARLMTPSVQPSKIERVSTLEMFFDLVFVFTITQVARLVSDAHGIRDRWSASLILMIAFWMYGSRIRARHDCARLAVHQGDQFVGDRDPVACCCRSASRSGGR